MSYYYSKNSIEELKAQVNIVDVVGRAVELKRAGAYYKGLCPFHHEKTPSFHVSDTRQFFTCFGCGEKGDVIDFMRKFYNLEFNEAVEKLADEYGIKLQKRGRTDEKLDQYYEVNRKAAEFFYRAFTSAKNPGYTYLSGRGMTPPVMKRFGIGYADDSWNSLYDYLTAKGVDRRTLLDLSLVSEKNGHCYDRFRNRVMFPYINTAGKVIGFGGRALEKDAQAKYLNSSESRVFQKKNNLYGLNLTRSEGRKEGYMILVEGYMDMISLYQYGIRNVCASCGTALTQNQARLLKRYTDNVVLSYDADNAGRNAALRGIEILRQEGIGVKVLHVSDGKDPDDFVKQRGKEAFLELIRDALPYADYKLDAAKRRFRLTESEGRIGYMKAAAGIIAGLDPVEQEEYKKIVAADMEVPVTAIEREVELLRQKAARGRPSGADSRQAGPAGGGDTPPGRGGNAYGGPADPGRTGSGPAAEADRNLVTPLEKTLIKLILLDPHYLDKIRGHETMLQNELSREVYQTALRQRENGRYDPGAIIDSLPDDEAAEVRTIADQIQIDEENRDQVFRECLESWRRTGMAKREEELIAMLSMADEEQNAERIRELSEELIRIQKEKGTNQ